MADLDLFGIQPNTLLVLWRVIELLQYFAILILVVYFVSFVWVFRKGDELRVKYPSLADNTHLLSGLAFFFTLLFFSFELLKAKEDSVTSKQSHTLSYLTDIEDQSVFLANEASKRMLQITMHFLNDPSVIVENPVTKITGGFPLHYSKYLDDNANVLNQYRKRVMQCLTNKLCNESITKSYVCPNLRAYLHPVITQRHAYFQKCLEPKYPNTVSVSPDESYDFFIDFCEIDLEDLSTFNASFLNKIDDSFCAQY